MASWRVPLTLMGLALAICACAAIATADPDPPLVDGGSTTFTGNWTVDPLDDLRYVNQTIVLDGNLTVDENGTLELRNCTLVMNSTIDGQFSIEVRANGTMRALQGTTVECRIISGNLGPRFTWYVRALGRVVLDGSRLVGAGWDDGHPGLVLEGDGSAFNRSSIAQCHRGLTVLGGLSDIENLTISDCTVGILWMGGSSTLGSVSCLDCTDAGVVLEGCDGVTVANLTARRCGTGLRVVASATGTVVRDVDVRNATVGVNCSADGTLLERISGLDCDVCVRLSGNDTRAADLTVSMSPSSPPATAGVLVSGDAQRVRLQDLDISGCDDAVLVLGACSGLHVSGLTVRSATDGALAFDASPSRAEDVRLERLTLSVAGASYGLLLRNVDGVVVDTADIAGPPSFAVYLQGCGDVLLASVKATASQRVISVDGSGGRRNVTVSKCDIEGAQYGIWAEDVGDLNVVSSIFLDSSIDCVMARRTTGLRVISSAFSGGLRSGIEVFSCVDVTLEFVDFSDVPYPVYMEDADALIDNCDVDSCDTGMWFASCSEISILDINVIGSSVAFLFNASTLFSAFSLDISGASDAAVILEGGTADCIVETMSVRSSTTAVRLRDAATSSVLLKGLDLGNCTEGVNATGAGSGIIVNATKFVGLGVGVAALGGSEVRVEDGSFANCTIALLSDGSSWLNWTVASIADFENCSAVLRGLVELLDGGSLNISRSDVTFLSMSDLESGVSSAAGSTLRLMGSSISAGPDGSFHISSSGALDVRGCNISGGTPSTAVGALTVKGDAAWVGTTTFSDSAVAVRITGGFATIAGCDFVGNTRADIAMDGALRPTVSGCDFLVASIGITGTFEGSLSVSSTFLDGRGTLSQAFSLGYDASRLATLTLRNVTIAHFSEGADAVTDQHQGSTLIEDSVLLDRSGLALAPRGGALVQLRRLAATNSSVFLDGVSFIVEGCNFNWSNLTIADCPQGGLVDGCSFEGTHWAGPAIDVSNSRYVTVTATSIDVGEGALVVRDGSSLFLSGSVIAISDLGPAIDVESSQLQAESCALTSLADQGLRANGVSTTVELANCSISAATGGAGHAIEVISNAEAWLINTTFDRASVLTADSGQLHVTWFATFELRLPWGGTIDRPTRFTATDAQGDEVVNTTDVRDVFNLEEFFEDTGARTMLTPHTLVAEDLSRGVRWSGALTFDMSRHVPIGLLDVELPQARAGSDKVVTEDSIVELNGTSSSDNDPTFGSSGVFMWSFDEYGTTVNLTGARVDHVFSVPGSFNITLTVRDTAGNEGIDLLVVQVLDRTAPVIAFEGNVTIDEDVVHIFDASATSDNDPRFSVSNGRFVWTFQVATGQLTLEGATVGALFAQPGTYTAHLTVFDRENNTAGADFWVEVLDRTPPEILGVWDVVVFSVTPNLLNGSRCVDNVGIASFQWVVEHGTGTITLEGSNPQYTFDDLGTYDVSLTVVDTAGNANGTGFVVVYDDLPAITLPSHVVSMAGVPMEVTVKVEDEFNTGLSFRLVTGPGGVTFNTTGQDGAKLLWTPQGGPGGYEGMDVMFDVAVNDGYVDAVGRMTVRVNPSRGAGNHAPVISSEPPLAAKRAAPYIYSVLATDPDGDRLGYLLVAGPDGMAVSVEGTVSWTPPFEAGTIAVQVRLIVTDGQATAFQEWSIRFREPPNQVPRIAFSLPSLEVKVHEEFTVDLSPFVPDGGAYQVDADDPNLALRWSVLYNASAVELLVQDKLLFRFRALDVSTELELEFVVTDPSGANDSTTMGLVILPPPVPGEEGDWWLWALLLLVVAGALGGAGASVSASRRRRRLAATEARIRARDIESEAERPVFEPTAVPHAPAPLAAVAPSATVAPGPSAGAQAMPSEEDVALELDEQMLEDELDDLLAEVGTFQEIPTAARAQVPEAPPAGAPAEPEEQPPQSLRARAAAFAEAAEESVQPPQPVSASRPFVLEGVAVLGSDGRTMASTGRVEEVIDTVRKAMMDVLAARDATDESTLEVDGRRVIVMARDGMGVVGIIRGREDSELRPQISAALDNMHAHPDRTDAMVVIEDLLAAAGGGARAEVVKGAWTAHLRAHVVFKGHHVVLEAFIRNDTEALMHNVRVDISYDHDALALVSVRPRLLVSQDRVSVGNLPPGKSTELEVSFDAELCLSSPMSLIVTYTDAEGRRVQVPAKPMHVDVRPPRLAPSGAPTDSELLALADGGLPHKGRKAFEYATDAQRIDMHSLAVRKVKDAGLMVVREVESQETMRTETWLAGTTVEKGARAVVRVSTHGADRLLEAFVASDDASVVVGLLTSLSGTIMDSVGSAAPAGALKRVVDARKLSDLEVWPTLLEYELDGE